MAHFHCKSAGLANMCKSCINNPEHQLSEPRRQTLAPSVNKGQCRHYVQLIRRPDEKR